ncbi:MAG: SGNH/GDSL hydrolase family protein [Candidatus Weimeria sp.]
MNYKKFTFTAAIFLTVVFSFFIFELHPTAADKPKLLTLYVQEDSGEYNTARLTFSSTHVGVCYIYRKVSGGSYSRIASVHSSGGTTSYTDKKLPKKGVYIYTVRSKGLGISGDSLSSYDHEGLATIRGKSIVTADITNLHAKIRWTANDNATSYTIYRKIDDGSWKAIETVNKDRSTYTDVYSSTFTGNDKKNVLLNSTYLDTSSHTISYTVRGVRRYTDFSKRSLSPYDTNGYYNFEAPIIVDADTNKNGKVTILFTRINHATNYLISSSKKLSDGSYKRKTMATVRQTKETYISCTFTPEKGYDYINVTAVATRNGNEIEATSYDGFTTSERNYQYRKILFIGDSITYGSPYKTDITRYIFSYPWRIGELTNAYYYNAAIPGATMAYKSSSTASFHRYRIISDVVPQIKMGKTPIASKGLLETNSRTFEDFDTIVICAGTNDYTDGIPVGKSSSKSQSTYSGALNLLLQTIQKADNKRVKNGKSHITVIMPDLFYSDRCTSFTHRMSRYSTKNSIGYTLKNYNDAKNRILNIYKKKGLRAVRFKTSSFVNQKNCPYTTADNLHMTKYTYEKIGNALADVIIRYWKASS